MDEDEDELEPPFGVLSRTTFDPLLAYQPHSYSDSLNIEQDDLIVEDTDTKIVADSAMEDTEMESWKAEASVTTEALQPFSWMPTSVSSPLHAMFTGVSSTQLTAPVNTAMRVLAQWVRRSLREQAYSKSHLRRMSPGPSSRVGPTRCRRWRVKCSKDQSPLLHGLHPFLPQMFPLVGPPTMPSLSLHLCLR
jgi:hypothetical protein